MSNSAAIRGLESYLTSSFREFTISRSLAQEIIEDYAALKAKCDALAAEVVNIREQAENVYAAGYQQGHLNTVDGIAYAPPIETEFYHNALQVMLEVEAPATDAYLNSVRADAVNHAGKMVIAMMNHQDKGVERALECIAEVELQYTLDAQLRAGEPS